MFRFVSLIFKVTWFGSKISFVGSIERISANRISGDYLVGWNGGNAWRWECLAGGFKLWAGMLVHQRRTINVLQTHFSVPGTFEVFRGAPKVGKVFSQRAADLRQFARAEKNQCHYQDKN